MGKHLATSEDLFSKGRFGGKFPIADNPEINLRIDLACRVMPRQAGLLSRWLGISGPIGKGPAEVDRTRSRANLSPERLGSRAAVSPVVLPGTALPVPPPASPSNQRQR